MHLPEKSPRPSIYYQYKVFDPWLASQHEPQSRHGVTIVGAGPDGLVTALELARFGVQSVVLNSELQVSQALWRLSSCLPLKKILGCTRYSLAHFSVWFVTLLTI